MSVKCLCDKVQDKKKTCNRIENNEHFVCLYYCLWKRHRQQCFYCNSDILQYSSRAAYCQESGNTIGYIYCCFVSQACVLCFYTSSCLGCYTGVEDSKGWRQVTTLLSGVWTQHRTNHSHKSLHREAVLRIDRPLYHKYGDPQVYQYFNTPNELINQIWVQIVCVWSLNIVRLINEFVLKNGFSACECVCCL